jgi:hypothetical protein
VTVAFPAVMTGNAFGERSYPVAALGSCKISRSMLYTRLARVIFGSARVIPEPATWAITILNMGSG